MHGIPRASAMNIECVSGIFVSGTLRFPLNECGSFISHIPAVDDPADGVCSLSDANMR